MKSTVLVNMNGGCQIPAQTRKAMGIEPGDLIEIDVVMVVKKAKKPKKQNDSK